MSRTSCLHGPFRRRRRGAGSLFGALLLLSLGALWLLQHESRESLLSRQDLARTRGAVLALGLEAAHRAAQEDQAGHAGRLAGRGRRGYELTGAELAGHLPPGLPGGGVRLGIIDDGAGLPLAYAVLPAPGPDAALPLEDSIREGALAAGLRELARAGAPHPMARHLTRIEAALGGALGQGSLYATADLALPVQASRLYRRPQPGRPELTKMETDLGFADGVGIWGAGNVTARAATANGVTAHGRGEAGRASAGGEVLAATLETPLLGGPDLTIDTDLVVGTGLYGPRGEIDRLKVDTCEGCQ